MTRHADGPSTSISTSKTPRHQSALGFDSGDWLLDVVGTPASWAYTDEDDLDWAEESGLVSSDWVARTREASQRASAALVANAWPFGADWDRWLPSVDLASPVLPIDWQVVTEPGTGV